MIEPIDMKQRDSFCLGHFTSLLVNFKLCTDSAGNLIIIVKICLDAVCLFTSLIDKTDSYWLELTYWRSNIGKLLLPDLKCTVL
jgi:hypothetical protein